MSKITAYFRRAALRNGIVVRSRSLRDGGITAYTYAAFLEMANYGYRVTPEALAGMSETALADMLNDARTVKGADRDMTPIYPGFPKQVQDLPTLTLLAEQILHYWTGGAFLPDYPTVVRENLPLADIVRNVQEVTVTDAGSAARALMTKFVRSGVAVSDSEKSVLWGAVDVLRPDADAVREALKGATNGENIQTLIEALIVSGTFTADEAVIEFATSMRNVDQLLRLTLVAVGEPITDHADAADRAVHALSDKDGFAIRMNTLSRPARRALVARLGELTGGFFADRLVLRNNLWRRVMRSVHPYSLKLTDESRRAADIIHGNVDYRTLDSLVEAAIGDGDAIEVVSLLSENRPSELLARLVEILRISKTKTAATELAKAVEAVSATAPVTTLIRAYNGVLAANFDGVRVVREAGRNNHLMSVDRVKVNASNVKIVSEAVLNALRVRLSKTAAPEDAVVGTISDMAVPLVRRDLSNTDRVVDRGTRLAPVGDGDVLRVFSHWTNTTDRSGYLDVGVAVLDADFSVLAVTTWNTWEQNRKWSTYSGDCNVHPGHSAVEFFDVDIPKLRKEHCLAKYAVMTVQSYSGIKLSEVDMVAGTMLRTDADKGASFDARTVTSAFSPTTDAYQALPLVVDLDSGEMIWLDASSGSTATGMSAANDHAIGPVVRDELARPRMTMGELAELWAQAHGVETVEFPVNRDAVLALLD